MKVFISHTSRDRDLADALRHALVTRGHEVIHPTLVEWGADITQDISRALRTADVVVAVLSERNPNVMYELGLSTGAGKPTIVVARDADDLPFDLRTIPYISITGSPPDEAAQVVSWIEDMAPPHLEDPLSGLDPESALQEILRSPELADRTPAITLERLLAELFADAGFEVSVPEGHADFGFDFEVHTSDPPGRFLVVTKLYRAQTLVSVSTVRQLAGVVTAEDATRGVLISTSGFTGAAAAFAEVSGVALYTLADVFLARPSFRSLFALPSEQPRMSSSDGVYRSRGH